MPVEVAITQNADIEKAIFEALGYLDLGELFTGRLVAIKPNDTFATATDRTGVTQPDTLGAIIRFVRQFGPRRLVVSGGSGAGETDKVFRVAGLMDVVEHEGVEFIDHNRPPFVRVDLDYGPQREVMVNPFVLELETLVSLAQLKLHETATVTLSMKNIGMSFPAADYYGHPRGSYRRPHRFFGDIHGFIVGMVRRFPIQLAVIVGHPAMIATGPLGGKAVETGLVIASRDCVAADCIGARLLGFEPQGVRHLFESGRLSLGETHTKRMRIKGMSLTEAVHAFTKAAYGEALNFMYA